MPTVWRTDANYEATRRRMVWNDRIPRRFPDVIVSVTSDADVIEAVKLARSRGLRIAVRAGGHSWIGTSLRDGGMLIDLSRLNGVTVDVAARTAAAQPAIKNIELVAALAPHELAFPAGHCPTVAIGGYLLAGGQGWNQGGWGIACSNVLAIDLVNAEGELITADAQHNTDLLWAARGGGPGFPGVILRYHLRLYPAPKVIMQSIYVYPLELIEAIVPWLAEIVPSLPSSVEQLLLLALPVPSVARQLNGRPQRYLTLWPLAYGDSAAEMAAALAPLDTCPVLDQALVRQVNTPVSFDDLFAIEAAVFPEGHRYDVGIIWSDADPTPVLSGLRDRLVQAPSLKTEILVAVTPPPTIDPSAREMAYSLAAPLYIGCYSVWDNAADDEANERWHRETLQSLEPITRGHYMGETDLLASPTRAAASLAPGVWERLQAIRRKYDPQEIFYGHIGQT
ncbi:MAG TPA: FAD-binding oxidoreductase [Candidatus Dormibacteraeota bacterium]|nr:FAD-binding oxidoreductase [Candidatus Dormibacteraeota bacterium]